MNGVPRVHDYNEDGICKDCCAIRLIAADTKQPWCPMTDANFARLNHQYYALIQRGRHMQHVLTLYINGKMPRV